MASRLGTALIVPILVTSMCRPGAPAEKSGTLPEGTLAAVGGERIDKISVERIAAAQGIRPSAARDKAVFDALFAAYARERFGPALAARAQKDAAARVLLEDLARRANEQGPPTDTEVAAATERRFWELDRPPLLRTTHAIVVVKRPEEEGRARALAERIRAAVSAARDPASFRAAVSTVPAGDLEVRVEDLDPATPDGRILNLAKPPPPGSTPGHYSDQYVRAAWAIPDVGAQSPVVETEFGYHVILAVERIPEHRVPLEERRTLLAPEILSARAEKFRDEVLAAARASTPVEVERAAMDLTERVKAVQ